MVDMVDVVDVVDMVDMVLLMVGKSLGWQLGRSSLVSCRGSSRSCLAWSGETLSR